MNCNYVRTEKKVEIRNEFRETAVKIIKTTFDSKLNQVEKNTGVI